MRAVQINPALAAEAGLDDDFKSLRDDPNFLVLATMMADVLRGQECREINTTMQE